MRRCAKACKIVIGYPFYYTVVAFLAFSTACIVMLCGHDLELFEVK